MLETNDFSWFYWGKNISLFLMSLCYLIYSVKSLTLKSRSWIYFSFFLQSSHSLTLSGPLKRLVLKNSGSILKRCYFIIRSSISFSFIATSWLLLILSNYSLIDAISFSSVFLSSPLFISSSYDLFFIYSLRFSISACCSQIFLLQSDFMEFTLSFSRLFSEIKSFLLLRSFSF